MKSKTLKFLALGGVAGPILFSMTTIICASLRPGYNHLHNFISELGATNTTNELIMSFGGFILSGLLFCCFAISLLGHVPKRLIPRLAAALLLIFGIGMMLAGIFACDPGCPEVGSIESTIHDRVSGITFFSVIIGMSLLGISFRKSVNFSRIWLYTLVSGVLAAVLLFVMISSFESRTFTGLWQRLLLLTIFQWSILTSLHILRNPTA